MTLTSVICANPLCKGGYTPRWKDQPCPFCQVQVTPRRTPYLPPVHEARLPQPKALQKPVPRAGQRLKEARRKYHNDLRRVRVAGGEA